MESTELLIDLLVRKLQEGNSKQIQVRLQELLDNARRGVALRARYAPQVGRRFLLQRRGE
jgi:hypothetical protein